MPMSLNNPSSMSYCTDLFPMSPCLDSSFWQRRFPALVLKRRNRVDIEPIRNAVNLDRAETSASLSWLINHHDALYPCGFRQSWAPLVCSWVQGLHRLRHCRHLFTLVPHFKRRPISSHLLLWHVTRPVTLFSQSRLRSNSRCR